MPPAPLSNNSVSLTCLMRTLTFDHYPSEKELYGILLKDEAFAEIWKRIKPWGEEEEVMVEITIFDKVNNKEQKGYLSFLYDEDFGKIKNNQ